MSSDYSRLIFDEKKHYSSVRMQQGRVLLDSDWNSQSDISRHRKRIETVDVIGLTGVPIKTNGYLLSQNEGGLSLSPGRIYINGLLCELHEAITMTPGSGSLIIPSGENSLPYALIDRLPENGNFLIYLEAWEREITYLDDPIIREKALGDPDTTTRLQTVWHLKFAEVEENSSCDSIDLSKIENAPTGQMEARTVSSEMSENPCDFNQTSGYRRLENQLYRIEIQDGGNLSESTFKWSRENASIMAKVTELSGGNTVKVHSLGRDDVLGFGIGDWVEFVNHKTNLERTVNNLHQITEINRSTNEIKISGSVEVWELNGLKIIRWDQADESIPLNTNFTAIEDGIEVRFKTGTYRPGDHWLIPARTIDSSIEWEPDTALPPKGVQTNYAEIGIVEISNGDIQSVTDCRKLFPPLTDLPGVSGGCSTYHVKPQPGWERIFSRIKKGEHAKICFEIGTYNLTSTVTIKDKGHLVITGCGPGTFIRGNNIQTALRFETCQSVDISNLSFQTNSVKNQFNEDKLNLKGGLTFVNTESVTIEKIKGTCGQDPKPQASCITYYNDKQHSGSINIRNCKFDVGFYQHGVIIINANRSIVENNVINARAKPANLRVIDRIRIDNRTRRAFLRILMSNFATESRSAANETVSFGDVNLSFRTNPDLRNANYWNTFLRNHPPERNITTDRELRRHLERATALELMNDNINNSVLEKFVAAIEREDPPLGFQGIVIGGEKATEIHIFRNRIENFLQGIHIGLSHRHESTQEYDIINSARVEKNYVKNILPILVTQARHGIFVGNCHRLYIENNELELHRVPKAGKVLIDGIRVWGHLGRKGTISNNDIFSTTLPENSYNIGIKVENLSTLDRSLYWNVSWNSIFSRTQKMDLPGNFFSKYLDTNQ